MEKNNGNNLFSFRKKEVYAPISPNRNRKKEVYIPLSPNRNDISTKIPYGLKSNDRSSSKSDTIYIAQSNYYRDLEIIRKMQKQGIIRKLTKKDSLKISKIISLNEQSNVYKMLI